MNNNRLITVTLNPCIDKTVTVDALKAGGLNRITSVRYDLSGKGINLSSGYRALGGETTATGLMYTGDVAAYMAELGQRGIQHDFIMLEGRTRENLKIRDAETETITEVNEPGYPASTSDIESLIQKINNLSKTAWAVAFSGSIPPGSPKDIYETLVLTAKENGALTVLDCDGEMLKAGLKAAPDIIKPNWFELEQIVGTPLETNESIADATKKLIASCGVRYAAVTLGADGAMLISEKAAYLAHPMKLAVQSATGAGDTFAAGMLTALRMGLNEKEILRWGMAAAGDAVTRAGTQVCTLSGTKALIDKIVIEEM